MSSYRPETCTELQAEFGLHEAWVICCYHYQKLKGTHPFILSWNYEHQQCSYKKEPLNPSFEMLVVLIRCWHIKQRLLIEFLNSWIFTAQCYELWANTVFVWIPRRVVLTIRFQFIIGYEIVRILVKSKNLLSPYFEKKVYMLISPVFSVF